MTPLTTRSIEPALQHDRSHIDWGAILAGTVIATSISVVLTGFGSAIGLSMTSPFEGKGFSGVAIAVAIGLWVVWVAVSSLIAGSYLAGRMRRRAGDATPDEVSVRDGVHGLVVWALAALIGVVLASMSVAGLSGILCQGPVWVHRMMNLSSNRIANCDFASDHSRADIFHSAVASRKTR